MENEKKEGVKLEASEVLKEHDEDYNIVRSNIKIFEDSLKDRKGSYLLFKSIDRNNGKLVDYHGDDIEILINKQGGFARLPNDTIISLCEFLKDRAWDNLHRSLYIFENYNLGNKTSPEIKELFNDLAVVNVNCAHMEHYFRKLCPSESKVTIEFGINREKGSFADFRNGNSIQFKVIRHNKKSNFIYSQQDLSSLRLDEQARINLENTIYKYQNYILK